MQALIDLYFTKYPNGNPIELASALAEHGECDWMKVFELVLRSKPVTPSTRTEPPKRKCHTEHATLRKKQRLFPQRTQARHRRLCELGVALKGQEF